MRSLIFFLLLSLLSHSFLHSQEQIPVQIPQVFPVSPEAASLGKYGDIPIDLSTGRINYNVPLYTIKVGTFEWPIYLSYNYTGFLVENDPGYTGLGWDLFATGRITREILGVPDELDNSSFKATTVVPYLTGAFDGLSYADYENKRFQIYNNISNLNVDGQHDNYIISAGNINGTFKLNENNEAIFLVHRNYIADKNFITDENGVKYYFDEVEIAEYTITYGSDNAIADVPSSYLLTKIELPNNGGEILFEYKPFDVINDIYTKTVWSSTEITGIENRIVVNQNLSRIFPRVLKRIIFPNGKIDFTITPHLQQYSNQHGSYSKKSYTLKDLTISNLDKQILKYDFIYNSESQSNKMLKEIKRSNLNNTETFYKFNYYNESSVSSNLDHTAQDFWGYYNGRPANTLIQASREIDTLKTKYGALQKIIYPTGGSTSINYEQNKIYSEDSGTSLNCSYTHNDTRIRRLAAQNASEYHYLENTVDVGHSQIVKVVITAAVKRGTTSNALGNEAFITVTANNASEFCGFSTISNFSLNADAENCSNYTSNDLCWGDLIMTKEIVGYAEDGIINISGYVKELANKEAYIEYKVYYENTSLSGGNKNVGGIRVASTTDCNGSGSCKITQYNYNQPGKLGIERSSGVLLGGSPQFEYSTYHDAEPKQGGGTLTGNRNYTSSRSRFPFTSYMGSPVLYELVTIKVGDGTNGYIKNEYSIGQASTNPGNPFLGATNYDWQKGKLLSTSIYKRSGTMDVLTKTITNEYSTFYPYGFGQSSTKLAYGMDVARVKWRYWATGIYEGEPDDYKEDYNYYYPKEYKQIKTVIEDFSDQTNPYITTSENSYDLPNLQLKKTSTVDSNGEMHITKFYYPYDLGITALVNGNNIAQPVKIEEYKDVNGDGAEQTNELLQTRQNEFTNWGSGIYLPDNIKTSKGLNSLESRIRYHLYDLSGNPLEVSQENGPHSVYLWGYNKQHPIAKIENATASQVGQYLGILSDVNETDFTAIDNLRASLPNAQVTSYQYEPLVGVTKITDPRGKNTIYHYDHLNRLQYVRDDQGFLLKEFKYNYKD